MSNDPAVLAAKKNLEQARFCLGLNLLCLLAVGIMTFAAVLMCFEDIYQNILVLCMLTLGGVNLFLTIYVNRCKNNYIRAREKHTPASVR